MNNAGLSTDTTRIHNAKVEGGIPQPRRGKKKIKFDIDLRMRRNGAGTESSTILALFRLKAYYCKAYGLRFILSLCTVHFSSKPGASLQDNT